MFEYNIWIYLAMFFIFAVVGWIIETTLVSIKSHKFINRGFLVGPYCPIYGNGVVLIHLLLHDYFDGNPVTLVILIIVVCGILEFFTSYFMEKLFKTRWWDYSGRNLNLNGRICLDNLVWFGIGGALVVYLNTHFLLPFLTGMDQTLLKILLILFSIFYVADTIFSSNIVIKFRTTGNKLNKDSTEEIGQRVREVLNAKHFTRRLAEAFPNFRLQLEKNLDELSERIKNGVKKNDDK